MRIVKTIFSFLLDAIETIVVAASLFVVVYLFLAQPHQVIGNSMVPNFHDKEFILTDKISYGLKFNDTMLHPFRDPKRGEVVVFKSPEDPDKDYIKRVIGLPFDRIKIQGGKVFINGEQLVEDYLDPNLLTPTQKFLQESDEKQIPDGQYAVFGDNRVNSSDSRSWGFLKASAIIGRVMLVYWPPQNFRLIPAGTYR